MSDDKCDCWKDEDTNALRLDLRDDGTLIHNSCGRSVEHLLDGTEPIAEGELGGER